MKKMLLTFILGCLFMGAQGDWPLMAIDTKTPASQSLTVEDLRQLEARVKALEQEFAGERAKEKKSWFGQYQERRKEERARQVEKKRILKEERESSKQRADRLYEEAKQLIRGKRFKEAKKDLEEVDRLDPNRHWVNVLLMEVDSRIQRDVRNEREERLQRRTWLVKREAGTEEPEPAKQGPIQKKRVEKKEGTEWKKQREIEEKREKSEKDKRLQEIREEKRRAAEEQKSGRKRKQEEKRVQEEKRKEEKTAQLKERAEAKAIYQRVAAKRKKSDKKRREEEKEQKQAEKERQEAEREERIQKSREEKKLVVLAEEDLNAREREARQSRSKEAVDPEKEQGLDETASEQERLAREQKRLGEEFLNWKVAKKKPQEKPTYSSFLIQGGETALEVKQYNAAIAAYEAALKLEPESSQAQRGIRTAQMAKKEEARKAILAQLDRRQRVVSKPITIYFHDATLAEMLEHLQKISGADFVISDEVKQDQDRRTIFIQEVPLEDALQQILEGYKEFVYSVKNQTVSITKPVTAH